MDAAKHTPGPWEVWGDHVVIRKPNRAGAMIAGNVCTTSLSPRQTNHGPRQDYPSAKAEQAANARLIAAAPDLLTACRLTHEYAVAQAEMGYALPGEIVGALFDAIRKATNPEA
jgi:hypothetical protein